MLPVHIREYIIYYLYKNQLGIIIGTVGTDERWNKFISLQAVIELCKHRTFHKFRYERKGVDRVVIF